MKNPFSHTTEYELWLAFEFNEMHKAFHGSEADRCANCERIVVDYVKVDGEKFCADCLEGAEGSEVFKAHEVEHSND